MDDKLVLDELRTIKLMCIANFIELQEIRRKLDIAEQTDAHRYEYANHAAEHLEALTDKLRGIIKNHPHSEDSARSG